MVKTIGARVGTLRLQRVAGVGGVSMRWLCCLFVLVFVVAPAAAQECDTVLAADKCPNSFVERCHADEAFKRENSTGCLRLINTKQLPPDPAECRATAACREQLCLEPKVDSFAGTIEEYFQACGQHNCPTDMGSIKERFASIAANMNLEFNKYGGILDIDIANIGNTEVLCAYSLEQMKSFKQLATADRRGLDAASSEISLLQTCSLHVKAFISGAKRKWTNGLKQDLMAKAEATRLEAAQHQVTAMKKIKKLLDAPDDIRQLDEIYTIACKKTPKP